MARTAVEIKREQLERALKQAEALGPYDPKAKEIVDKAREGLSGALLVEEIERKKNHG